MKKRELPLHLMILPGALLVLVFSYGPMAGLIMAFQNFVPAKGVFQSDFVGMKNFEFFLQIPDVKQVVWNTVFIAAMKIVFGTVMSIGLSLLLHEISVKWFKRSVQTLIYIPYFLSWIILGGILREILSLDGAVNQGLVKLGMEPIYFLGDKDIFPYLLVLTEAWQTIGFGTIVYLAAMSGISPTLYESSVIDGANRVRQLWHITLPGIRPIIVLLITLSLGNILNAGFDQVFVLYSPLVYETGDIIDTWVYRAAFESSQYSLATAAGLFKSVVAFILITVSYVLANKYANYRIF